jgi:hypothetical protein
MKNLILKSTLLEFDKSAYTLELKTNEKGKLFIVISQKVKDENHKIRKVLINPTTLPDLIRELK